VNAQLCINNSRIHTDTHVTVNVAYECSPDDFLEDVNGDLWHATDKLFKVLRCD